MHCVLECAELVQVIYSYLGHPALAALAITCKGLGEPALDAIWEELRDFDRVLALFPRNLFKFRLARPIMPVDWDRPRLYAPRIKKLQLDWDQAEILQAIGPFCPSGLFPNLHSLACVKVWQDITPFRALFHPRLKVFSSFFPPTISNLSFLSALAVLCPQLTGLHIILTGEESCPETGAVISTLVLALEALEYLELGIGIHAEELNLGLLPNLKALSLSRLPKKLEARSSPRLQALIIHSVDIVAVLKLVYSSVGLELIKISLGLSPATTSLQMAELVRGLKRVASPMSLEILMLQPSDLNTVRPHVDVMTADALRELSFFCSLMFVRIIWSFGPDLDDTTLELLTISWTRLKNLWLEHLQRGTNLTLKSFLALARNCPHLYNLTLEVDAREVPELPDVAPQRTLESMDIMLSPIQNATKVARYLSGIFPDVKCIRSGHSTPSFGILGDPLWYQVSEQLPEFAAVRKEEREKAQKRMGDGPRLVS
ncbi:hypothetical protein MSAN_00565000 [Mycena sanguinolenta]|uniref:F-box domain-containing protein n=1 Tax=Mycena sanguinolenta TaxID=230812 RepID=A0A8H6ZAX0_9AGAR|nr:hypothetical protein MSAN_00565000 [Mycena sanguinolenta]